MTPGLERLSLALVTPPDQRALYGLALARAFGDLGIDCRPHDDGDPAMLEADGIILAGYLPRLCLTKALLRRPGPRPPVLAWAYEPLVPEDIAPWAKRLALMLAPATEGRKGNLWLRLTRPGFIPIALFGLGHWGARSTPKELQFAFGHSIWLRGALEEGLVDRAAVSTVQKGHIVAEWGHPWLFAPLSAELSPDPPRATAVPRDLDVLFLGRLGKPWRRTPVFSIVRQLRRAGLGVRVVSQGLRGAAREEVLGRTRLILHLTRFPWDTAWLRFYHAANHGIAVASEPLSVPDPLRPGIDYLQAAAADLPAAILALLADETARAAMAATCAARIAAEMTFADGVRRMADAIATLRPAVRIKEAAHAG